MNGIHKRSISNFQNSILISKLTNPVQNKEKNKVTNIQDRQSLSGQKLKTTASKIAITNNQIHQPKINSTITNNFKTNNDSDNLFQNSTRLNNNRPSQASTLRTNLLGQLKNFTNDDKIRVRKPNSNSKSPVEFSSRLQRASVTNDLISFSIDKFKNNKSGISMTSTLNKLKLSPKKTQNYKTKSTLSKYVNPMTKSYNTILRDKSPMIALKISKNSKESTPKSSNSKLTSISKSPLSHIDKKNNLDMSSNSRNKDSFDKSYSAYSPMSNDSKIKVIKKIQNNGSVQSVEKLPEPQFNKIVVESNRIFVQSSRSPEINKNVSKITNFNNSSLLKKYEELRLKNQSLKNNAPNKIEKISKNLKSENVFKSNEDINKSPLPRENKTSLQIEEEKLKNLNANKSNLNASIESGIIKVNRAEIKRQSEKIDDFLAQIKENKDNSKLIKDNEAILIKKRLEQKTPEPNLFKIKSHFNISKMGYSGPGVKKVNQDNLFMYTNFNDEKHCIYTAVCDGHGMFGHEVSSYLRDHLPVHLHNELRAKKVDLRTCNVLIPKSSNSSPPPVQIKEIIEDAFLSINMKLFNDTKIDTAFSGSTCVSVIYTGNKLICANVGDSRAVVGQKRDAKWSAKNLSRDHKPSEKDEAARIKRRGGRIEAYKGKFIRLFFR
jgi:hypothetical protein